MQNWLREDETLKNFEACLSASQKLQSRILRLQTVGGGGQEWK